jgi:hypothetical protein
MSRLPRSRRAVKSAASRPRSPRLVFQGLLAGPDAFGADHAGGAGNRLAATAVTAEASRGLLPDLQNADRRLILVCVGARILVVDDDNDIRLSLNLVSGRPDTPRSKR